MQLSVGEEKEQNFVGVGVLSLFCKAVSEITIQKKMERVNKKTEKTCGMIQHVRIVRIWKIPNLKCGKDGNAIEYLARYAYRTAISNSRIVSVNECAPAGRTRKNTF